MWGTPLAWQLAVDGAQYVVLGVAAATAGSSATAAAGHEAVRVVEPFDARNNSEPRRGLHLQISGNPLPRDGCPRNRILAVVVVRHQAHDRRRRDCHD